MEPIDEKTDTKSSKIKALFSRFLAIPALYAVGFWLLAGGCAFLAADFVVMPIVSGRYTRQVQVPTLVGLPGAEAEKTLQSAGLQFKWNADGRFSSQIPAGAVFLQVPPPGQRIKKGRTIFLTASKGLREVVIPELRGRSPRQAEISLHRSGLVQGKLISGAHASIPRGVVIRTDPPAGRTVRVGQVVDIVLSAGASEGRVRLPDLTGFSVERARAVLDSLGFSVGAMERKSNEEKLPNTILGQAPRHGEFLDSGSVVDLVVSD